MTDATYLRLVPQNFDATVYDTGDLSTVRGASTILLHAPDLLLSKLKEKYEVSVIQNAASELFVSLALLGAAQEAETPDTGAEVPEGIDPEVWEDALTKVAGNKQAIKEINAGNIDGKKLTSALNVQLGRSDALKPHRENLKRQVVQRVVGAQKVPGGSASLSGAELADVRELARAFLAAKQDGFPLQLMSFGLAVANLPATLDPLAARDRMDALVRLSQMQSLSLPMPTPSGNTAAKSAVCGLTGQLPATEGLTKDGKSISLSVDLRRKIGRGSKQNFYLAELEKARALGGDANELKKLDAAIALLESGDLKDGFAQDFQELVSGAPKGLPPSLRSGIAVVSMDGNGFGAAAKRALAGGRIEGFLRFSAWLERRKALLLADILIWIAAQPQERICAIEGERRAAFETLMWGGDEFEFVLPAWAAWEFTSYVAATFPAWLPPGSTKSMTFAIGLAFGKSKTPIGPLREAAQTLVGLAKEVGKNETIVQVAAYESVDAVAMTPAAFRADRYGASLGARLFALRPEAMQQAPAAGRELFSKAGFSGLMKWLTENRSAFVDLEKHAGEAAAALKAHLGRVGQAAEVKAAFLRPYDDTPAAEMVAVAQGLILRDYMRDAKGGVQ